LKSPFVIFYIVTKMLEDYVNIICYTLILIDEKSMSSDLYDILDFLALLYGQHFMCLTRSFRIYPRVNFGLFFNTHKYWESIFNNGFRM